MSDWLTISDLARERGVSKQAISKRLKGFGANVTTRREGQGVLVDVAAYDKACGQNTDPAQALRNLSQTQRSAEIDDTSRTAAPNSAPSQGSDVQALKIYSVQRARQASFDADLTKLKLEKESGRWIEAAKAQSAWAKELAAFIAETEGFIVNRLAREIAEQNGLDWKQIAVKAREMFRAFRATEANRQNEIEKELKHGITD